MVPQDGHQKTPDLKVRLRAAAKADPCERCFTYMYFAAVIAALVYAARILFES
jgi:hypothetical protein